MAHSLKKFYLCIVYMYTKVVGWRRQCMSVMLLEVRGQLEAVGSLLPPCGTWVKLMPSGVVVSSSSVPSCWSYWLNLRFVLFSPFCLRCYCMRQGLSRAQTGLKLVTLLSQPPECWDYRHESPCLVFAWFQPLLYLRIWYDKMEWRFFSSCSSHVFHVDLNDGHMEIGSAF